MAVLVLVVASPVGGVPLVEVAEEHVLQPVGDVEHADHRAARRLVERVEKHPLALSVDQIGLIEERVFVDHLFVQRRGVPRTVRGTAVPEADDHREGDGNHQ